MFKINENYLKLPGSYLFSTIAKKVAAYQEANPDKRIIRLGIGDVTLPIAPAIVEAIHKAADEMGHAETFHGYAPDLGYAFLRETIAEKDYKAWGCPIDADEIFVSDGAKSDSGNIQEIFSQDSRIALCDPVYPVYLDSNVMAGRTGEYDAATGRWSNVIYMPCTAENHFVPELPKERPDLIYLCVPNNPTGTALTRDQLKAWVDYANQEGCVILYDAAYEAYISEEDVPHSIFELEGARTCAIEICSLSKTAGFTGTRLGYTVVPKELERSGMKLHEMWVRNRTTKTNGVSYIIQKGGAAVFTPEGQEQIHKNIQVYKNNAASLMKTLDELGIWYCGGKNAPYIWMECPNGMGSWEFFDYLLREIQVVGTPGEGFGACGSGYFRLSTFGSPADTQEAARRLAQLLKK